MRSILCLTSAIILTLCACKKDGNKGPGDNTRLPKMNIYLSGSWKLIGSYLSSGGPQEWKPAIGDHYISFSIGGAFSGANLNSYILTPRDFTGTLGLDTILVAYNKNVQLSDTARYFISKITRDSLTLSYMGCIEGCSDKFVRVK